MSKEIMIRSKSQSLSMSQKQMRQLIRIQKVWRGYLAWKKVKKMLVRKKNKQYAIKELVDSEESYCQNLKMLTEQIVKPSKDTFYDQEVHQLLFSNLQDIYLLHNNFLKKLKETMKTYNHLSTKLSMVMFNQLFNKNDFNSKYSHYCANYRKSNQMAKLLIQNNSGFKKLLQKVNLHFSTALESELIKPMQRLCKYELILSKLHKFTETDHCDYSSLEEVATFVENMVKQTNDQVEQFLLDEKYRNVKYKYEKEVLCKIPNPNRKLLYSIEDVYLIDLIELTSTPLKEVVLFNDTVLVVLMNSKTIFIKLRIMRDLPNLKYFKNLVQLINEDKYLTIEFKKQKQKEQFISYLSKSLASFEDNSFVTVTINGTETRQSLFKNYTVYIVEIKFGDTRKSIYPRFKDMIRVENVLDAKKIKLNLPSLSKQTLFVTNKSKTIEKRKLAIQEFLEKVLNCSSTYSTPEIFKILKLEMKEKDKRNQAQVLVYLPSQQIVKVFVDVKNGKISELKEAVAESLGMEISPQFQIFQMKGKYNRRLLYDDEPISQIYEAQNGFNINPFKEELSYVYTRHHYLEGDEEFRLFKEDFVRIELQLSVIKAEVKHYRLEEELMITYMCLFAMYTNLHIDDDTKLTNFIKSIGKKMYKISLLQFRAYYERVEKRVEAEADELVTLPFLIIKIISNTVLYQCQQFDVQVHPKSLKGLKSYFPGIEQKIILGIKNNQILLLTSETKHTISSIPMEYVQIAELHHTALILKFDDIGPTLRLNTQNSYEISRLFQIYKGKTTMI